jgi:hypothetical protein
MHLRSRRKKTLARPRSLYQLRETDLSEPNAKPLGQNGKVVLKLRAIGSFRRRGSECSN